LMHAKVKKYGTNILQGMKGKWKAKFELAHSAGCLNQGHNKMWKHILYPNAGPHWLPIAHKWLTPWQLGIYA
jgi:hypothetical protein